MAQIKVKREEDLRNKFFDSIENYIDEKKFCLVHEKKIGGMVLDGYIEDAKKNPYAVFEFKISLNSSLARRLGEKQLKQYCNLAKVKFGILTDLKRFYLYTSTKKENQFEKMTLYQLLKTIFPKIEKFFVSKNYKTIKKCLKESKLCELELKSKDITFKNGAFSFSSEYESKFTKQLASFNFNDTHVCRYIPLDTIFQIIKTKKIRLNGIVGMNDSTESDFVERILYEEKLENIESQKKANNIYIMSCSSEKNIDNLTQWRLYGDEAKGACLVFKIKNNKKKNGFKLGKVQYYKYKGDVPAKNNNPSEILSRIKYFIDAVYNKTLFPFVFQNFHEWAHFYKPEDYQIEDEIRLLFVNNGSIKKQWFISNKINIINTYIEIPLKNKDFPLKLTQIYLGPKCPEKSENMNQLKAMLNEINRDDVYVTTSDIECYR